jgi:hypothetical protein
LAVNWSENTSRRCITRISGAEVVIVTKDWSLDEVSSQAIATVNVTFVLLSKSLQIIFRSVDASLYSIASIFGARIDISTNQRSMDAISASSITRINGTCIAIITILSDVLAISSSSIARINSARIVIVTVLRISVDSILAVTSRNGAWIRGRRNWNWSVNTFSGS